MKKRMLQLLAIGVLVSSMIVTPVSATPKQDKVNSLKSQKKAAEAEAASVNEELVSLLVEFDALKSDMKKQEERIDEATEDLKVAEEKEKEQYEAMKLRIKYMYEEGDSSFVETLVSSKTFSDLVSKAEYVQKVHNYDRDKLDEYVETKQEVAELKDNLEAGKADMEDMAEEMQTQQTNLESTLTQMRSEIENFDEQLEQAEAEAEAELKRLQEEAEQKPADTSNKNNNNNNNSNNNNISNNSSNNNSNNNSSNNSNNNSSDNKKDETSSDSKKEEEKEDDTTSSTPSNASLGQQIANKACEYVGNKYVYGGTSLTNGIDCSGFVQAIHAKFGISTPRTSSAQRSGGKAVKYSEMLPGDVVCYSGHVAIYIGNNKIVHASNSRPYPQGGIKISSPPNYRTVLAVRRYW